MLTFLHNISAEKVTYFRQLTPLDKTKTLNRETSHITKSMKKIH